MYRISAVCTGNICHSPMAQSGLTRAFKNAGLETAVSVGSSGVTAWTAGRALNTCTKTELLRHGFPAGGIGSFRARTLGIEGSWHGVVR